MGKSTISMAFFNSYVKLPEGNWKDALSCVYINVYIYQVVPGRTGAEVSIIFSVYRRCR